MNISSNEHESKIHETEGIEQLLWIKGDNNEILFRESLLLCFTLLQQISYENSMTCLKPPVDDDEPVHIRAMIFQSKTCRTYVSETMEEISLKGSLNSASIRILKSIGIKYVNQTALLECLSHLHMLKHLKMVVLNGIEDIMDTENIMQSIALTASMNNLQKIIVTSTSIDDMSYVHHLPFLLSTTLFRDLTLT